MNDASRLNADLDLETAKRTPDGQTLAHVAQGWMNSDRWDALSEHRKRSSAQRLNLIMRWSLANGHPDMKQINLSKVEGLLRPFNDRPALKLDVRSCLNVLFVRALAEGFIDRNPLDAIGWTAPPCRTHVWSEDDVTAVVSKATELGYLGLAGVVRTMWTTAQRIGDVCALRYGHEYRDGYLSFAQSKTDRSMRIPVVPELAAVIEASHTDGDYLFTTKHGRPYNAYLLHSHWKIVRAKLERPDAHLLHLRALRHSCVMRLAKAGATVPQISGLTGHKIITVTRMIEHYFGADDELTRQAITLDLVYSGKDPTELPDAVSRFVVLSNDNTWTEHRGPQKYARRRRRA